MRQRLVILGLAVLGVMSVFLPWATVSVMGFSESVNGLSSDADFNGIFVLIAFIAAGGLVLFGDLTNLIYKLGIIVTGALAATITLNDILTTDTGTTLFGLTLRLGFGIFLAFLVGVAIAAVPFLISDK